MIPLKNGTAWNIRWKLADGIDAARITTIRLLLVNIQRAANHGQSFTKAQYIHSRKTRNITTGNDGTATWTGRTKNAR
ncbi:hypothetical protein PILCRDRAFT_819003 [Piloderma croceum F 1598]|uniref:Uncharacterized protein n=1 Tax=Piloderma croceum (strain F 1598) TaxID=765440 RepID=A0A0C3G073_PILCF|nr:hypothetical protein PILCRDRAFT_819003 [Piloderma croceum F 1598]